MEVVVHEAVGDAGLVGDVGDLRAVKPRSREHLGRGGDDALAGLRAARRARRMSRCLHRLAHVIAPAARSDGDVLGVVARFGEHLVGVLAIAGSAAPVSRRRAGEADRETGLRGGPSVAGLESHAAAAHLGMLERFADVQHGLDAHVVSGERLAPTAHACVSATRPRPPLSSAGLPRRRRDRSAASSGRADRPRRTRARTSARARPPRDTRPHKGRSGSRDTAR